MTSLQGNIYTKKNEDQPIKNYLHLSIPIKLYIPLINYKLKQEENYFNTQILILIARKQYKINMDNFKLKTLCSLLQARPYYLRPASQRRFPTKPINLRLILNNTRLIVDWTRINATLAKGKTGHSRLGIKSNVEVLSNPKKAFTQTGCSKPALELIKLEEKQLIIWSGQTHYKLARELMTNKNACCESNKFYFRPEHRDILDRYTFRNRISPPTWCPSSTPSKTPQSARPAAASTPTCPQRSSSPGRRPSSKSTPLNIRSS